MVKWDGIEDTGPLPTRVWLSRIKQEDENTVNDEEWKPLRKVRNIIGRNLIKISIGIPTRYRLIFSSIVYLIAHASQTISCR